MTEAGIRAALAAGAAGVIAKSVNEQPAAARQLDRADYAFLQRGSSAGGCGRCAVLPLWPRAARPQRSGSRHRRDRSRGGTHRSFRCRERCARRCRGREVWPRSRASAGLRVFELNVGAPHASEATPGVIAQETDPDSLRTLVGRVRAVTAGMQLWVKLTGLSSNLPALALAASQGGANAVCMMGRFMAVVPDLDTLAPVLGTSGPRRAIGRCRSSAGSWH